MAQTHLSVTNFLFFLLILTLSIFKVDIDARPLGVVRPSSYIGEAIASGMASQLYIEAIKTGGPSPGGKGHESTNVETLGGIKNSGPGGKGHEFISAQTLGDVKNSGPSSGGHGHDFTNAESLGNIKNFGPSLGRKGHDIINADILGGIKNSGPAPGGKGHESTN